MISRETCFRILDIWEWGFIFCNNKNIIHWITQQDIYNFHEKTVLETLKEKDARKYVHNVASGLDLLTAEDHLARFPSWLYGSYRGNRSLVLKETLQNVQGDYDYIIIDTPPAR
ncbi:UNVERIFIED_CONTAM: cellulose biosynthesis protein BcsQ [Paenibacillus sp. PvR008]